MKKSILFAAFAVVAMTSCNRDVIQERHLESIGFTTYAGRSVDTKADGSLVDKGSTDFAGVAPEKQLIGVYAYLNGINHNADFMSNVKVKLAGNGGTSSADYSPAKYWPKDETNNKLSFFAYYPYTIEAANLAIGAVGTGNTITYTVKDTPATQEDLMIADYVKNLTYTNSDNGSVNFTFSHMLTRVRFQFALSSAVDAKTTVAVNSASISNIFKKGVLQVAETAAASNWTPSEKTNYTIPVPAGNITTTLPASFSNTNELFLLLPQTLADDAMLNIKYTVSSEGSSPVVNNQNVRLKDIKVGSTPLTEWNKKQNIVYTIKIGVGEHPISFKASVTDWESEEKADVTL